MRAIGLPVSNESAKPSAEKLTPAHAYSHAFCAACACGICNMRLLRLPACHTRGATRAEIPYALAEINWKSVGNQLEITEIWLEIRNQGLENPVEIRKSARNHEKSGKKSRNPREITPFLSEHVQQTFRACAFEKSARNHARNQSHEGGKSVGNHNEGGKSVGNHRNPEISYAEKARVVPLAATGRPRQSGMPLVSLVSGRLYQYLATLDR